MQKKQIIQIAVIVIAFGLAGLVLYNGLFKNNSAQPASTTAALPGSLLPMASSTSAAISSQIIQSSKDILPYGDKLNFNILHDPNGPKFQYDQYVYPQLDSKHDIGVDENTLISSTVIPGQ